MRKIVFLIFFVIFSFGDNFFTPSTGIAYDEKKAILGKKLFFDKRLSPNGTISCESCHNLYWDFSGTIRTPIHGNTINPPTIINVAANYLFGRDGNEYELTNQIKVSLLSGNQLGANEDDMLRTLNEASEYRSEFFKNYGNDINIDDIVDALENFIKAIFTANSPFDKYLLGDENAISADEKKGMEIFKKTGCVACHNGVNLGTNLKHKIDFYHSMISDENLENMGTIYRIPSLRNIARTSPYLYDGSIVSLKDVISHVAKLQLLKELTNTEVDYIYKFLLTLNGEHPRILQ